MAAMYAVTGGTGFLGGHLVDCLLNEGHEVRVLARTTPAQLPPPGVETVAGSILNDSDLEKAFTGAQGVFHLAGLVEHSRKDEDKIFEANVTGTLKVLKAAKQAGVRRVVYSSTSGVSAVSKSSNDIFDDSAPYARQITAKWPYYRTKIIAEEKALQFAGKNGLELICLRPTLILGPGDRQLSSCRTIVDLLDRKVPFVPGGGLSFVDVRDVAQAFVAAMTSGTPGCTYLLGSQNLLLADFFKKVEAVSGVPSPWLRVPSAAAWAMAASAHGISSLFGRWDPSLDPVIVEMSQHFWYLESTLAREGLGFNPRDPDSTIKDTVEWILSHRAELSTA